MQIDRDELERLMKIITEAQEELDELLPVAEDIDDRSPTPVTVDREWFERWEQAASRREAAENALVDLLRGAVGSGHSQDQAR